LVKLSELPGVEQLRDRALRDFICGWGCEVLPGGEGRGEGGRRIQQLRQFTMTRRFEESLSDHRRLALLLGWLAVKFSG